MTTLISRSALVWWGQAPAPSLAYVVIEAGGGRVVTWADVMAQRHARQQEQLRHKREERALHAFRLRVAFYDQDLFGGWHAFLETYRGPHETVWIDKQRYELREKLVALYPLVLPFGDPWRPRWPAWEAWKVAFADQYARRRKARKPVGVTYLWWDGRNTLRPIDSREMLPSTA